MCLKSEVHVKESLLLMWQWSVVLWILVGSAVKRCIQQMLLLQLQL